jgi:hypothetical protein
MYLLPPKKQEEVSCTFVCVPAPKARVATVRTKSPRPSRGYSRKKKRTELRPLHAHILISLSLPPIPVIARPQSRTHRRRRAARIAHSSMPSGAHHQISTSTPASLLPWPWGQKIPGGSHSPAVKTWALGLVIGLRVDVFGP